MGLGGLLQIRDRLISTADLSGKEYYLGQLDGTLAEAGEYGFPIVDGGGATGDVCTIVLVGKEKCKVGTGGMTAGGKLASDASGQVVAATTGDEVIGIALETAVAGDVAMILVVPAGIL